MKKFSLLYASLTALALIAACGDDDGGGGANVDGGTSGVMRSSSASQPEAVRFAGSASTTAGAIYEILPGAAVLNPAMNPTPFSNNTAPAAGSYTLTVSDVDADDSETSADAVPNVEIRFTGNDGTKFLIDKVNAIHKAEGTGDHSFFGGVGSNVTMHGDTSIGTALMPKMLAYITLWGVVDLKNADTGEVLAAGRIIHIMTGTRVRDENNELVMGVDKDMSDHDLSMAETHVILPPVNMMGQMSPVPGTDHGFLHMMFENVELIAPSRDPALVYEILPGPAAINPMMNPTPFSNRIAVGAGSYDLTVRDVDSEDSENSQDAVENFRLTFTLDDGTTYRMDNINVIHKAAGAGDHSFLGGVGLDAEMHGDTGIGTGLMPKMKSYITIWGTTDLKDGSGAVIAPNRMIHLMVASRARTSELDLITDTATDSTDQSPTMVETHVILPPQDLMGQMSPVPGTRHGFLHLMFEKVTLSVAQ